MLRYYLLSSYLSRHVEGNLLYKPRRFDHSRLVVFDISEGAWNDVAYAIYHSDAEMRIVGKIDFNGVFGNEFRLGCHYCSSRRRLRQFVRRTLLLCRILYIRNDERIHKSFYKGGFARPDRTDNTDIDVASGSCLNVLINACTCS